MPKIMNLATKSIVEGDDGERLDYERRKNYSLRTACDFQSCLLVFRFRK